MAAVWLPTSNSTHCSRTVKNKHFEMSARANTRQIWQRSSCTTSFAARIKRKCPKIRNQAKPTIPTFNTFLTKWVPSFKRLGGHASYLECHCLMVHKLQLLMTVCQQHLTEWWFRNILLLLLLWLLLLLLQKRLRFMSGDEKILPSNITPAKAIPDQNLEQHVSHGM